MYTSYSYNEQAYFFFYFENKICPLDKTEIKNTFLKKKTSPIINGVTSNIMATGFRIFVRNICTDDFSAEPSVLPTGAPSLGETISPALSIP